MNDPTATATARSSAADEDQISLLDLLQVVVDNLRLLLLVPLAAGLLALGISFTITPIFTASTQFLPPQQQAAAATMLHQLGGLGGLAGMAAGLRDPNDQFVAFLSSRAVQDALIERLQLMERFEAEFMHDARQALAGKVRISSGRDGLIRIEADDPDPVFAAVLANAHVDQLSLLLDRLAVTEAQQRRVFFAQQLVQAKEELTQAEQALKASGVNRGALMAHPAAAIEGLARLKASISAQEVRLATLRGYLTEAAPDFRQAQIELAALREQLRQAERAVPAGAGADSDYVARFRDFKYYETLFELFAKQYELARIDESREGAVIQVLDLAQPPERKSKPKRAQIAVLTTLASGFALLLFVFVRQALRNAGREPENARKLAALRQSWRKTIGIS